MNLAIGTAQFGFKYGISNVTGRTPLSEARNILDRAQLAGITTLDTAATYGESEKVLGCLDVKNWRIISKIPPFPENIQKSKGCIIDNLRQSLCRMNVDHIEGLLLHNAADILGPHGRQIAAGLSEAKESGLVSKVGYSIYSPEQLTELLDKMIPDLIQAPLNVLDQRLSNSGWLKRLADADIEVHTRSTFLQGLLLMSKESRPKHFLRWDNIWQQWDSFVTENGGSALTTSLGFVKAQTGISQIIVGLENIRHLDELLMCWKRARPLSADTLECKDLELIEPVNWSSK